MLLSVVELNRHALARMPRVFAFIILREASFVTPPLIFKTTISVMVAYPIGIAVWIYPPVWEHFGVFLLGCAGSFAVLVVYFSLGGFDFPLDLVNRTC